MFVLSMVVSQSRTLLAQFANVPSAIVATVPGMVKLFAVLSPKSSEYVCHAIIICLLLFRQDRPWAFAFALLKAGRIMAARMAMMAMTTNSSISVNAPELPA